MINNRYSSVTSLSRKLMLYFGAIAILVGLLLYVTSLGVMQWIEDQVSQNELQQSQVYAISAFQGEAARPLSIGLHTMAYYSLDTVPVQYGDVSRYPIDYIGEVVSDSPYSALGDLLPKLLSNLDGQQFEEFFLLKSEFEYQGLRYPLYLITPSETIELSDDEWLVIKLAVFIIIVLLFIAFGFAMHKLSKRLIEPVVQLNRQLKSASLPQAFTVPETSAAEFNQLAQSLNFYRQQTDAMIKQEQSFARYASHELRTPLTVIMGAAKLLAQDVSEAFQAKQRDRILRSAIGMQQTVDALLQLVKQEKGTEPDVPRPLLQQEVDSILESLKPLAKSKSVNLTLQFELAPIILLKPAVVKILLTNLISNAIHASDTGEISIVITKDKISVKDQGRGLDKAVKEVSDGHGLGLLIVDALCQRYQLIFSLTANTSSGCSANLVLPQLYFPGAQSAE